MKPFKYDNSFLARWVAGELTSQELENFRNSEEYALYYKINEASQLLSAPKLNTKDTFNRIQNNTINAKTKSKVKQLIPSWAYVVAAIVVLALGVFYFTLKETQYTTGFSEQLAIVLPDASKVQMNANTALDFKTFNWKKHRTLNLKGEAFFNVEKGKTFRVMTPEGYVEVLGTEFNVVARDGYFEVQCKEGKVQVVSMPSKEETILFPGKAVRVVNNALESWDFNTNEPSWLLGESTFYDTPIEQIFIALENQYQLKIDASQIDLNERYTGGFTHKDLNLALRTVLIPMELTYTFNPEKRVIILKSSN